MGLLSSLFTREGFLELLFIIPCVLVASAFHEFAHGWTAYKLGDPTARNFGRLTLNPLKHVDIMGAICMALFGFGWAKPVPVSTRYFKKPRRDMALTAAAGPVMNLLLAFVSAFISLGIAMLGFSLSGTASDFGMRVILAAFRLFSLFHTLNISLAIFNLIPLPPLDGSRVLFIFLPDRLYFGLMKYERYISMGFMILLLISNFTNIPIFYPLQMAVGWISNGMFSVAEAFFSLFIH